jgi:hypothetical protein
MNHKIKQNHCCNEYCNIEHVDALNFHLGPFLAKLCPTYCCGSPAMYLRLTVHALLITT